MSHCGPLRQMNKPTPDRSPRILVSPIAITNYLAAQGQQCRHLDLREEAPDMITVNPDRPKGEQFQPKPCTLERVKNLLDSDVTDYYYMTTEGSESSETESSVMEEVD